jgi:phage recombination protein Bet
MNTNTVQKTPSVKVETKPSALAMMASRLSVEPAKLFETLKQTVFQKASNEELLALVTVANEYGLNPFLKEIYAFPAKGGGIVPVVSVDGWNKMMVRQPDFDGIEFEFQETEDGKPVSCTATIYIKNRSKPVKVTEYLDECKRNTDPWNTMPHRMLRNRTLCQAARIAFGFSGVSNDDEVRDFVDVTSAPMPAEPLRTIPVAATEKQITPQAELEALVIGAGFTFDDMKEFGEKSGNITNTDSLTGFEEINSEEAKRMLKARTGLLNALKAQKGVA